MFEVKLSRDKLTCTMNETPDGNKLMQPTTMSCEVNIPLGMTPSPAAGKALKLGMDKTFNALVKSKSGSFLKDLKQKVKAIGVIIEKRGAEAVEKSDFLKKEEDQLRKLWQNWSDKIAPKLANQALQDVVKSTREKDLKDLPTKKIKAVGRVTAVPVISIISAAVSGLAGNPVGASSALVKAVSATMKASDDLSSALNGFKSDQAAVEKDVASVSAALKTMATRIKTMDGRRKTAEMKIAAFASQNKIMNAELKDLADSDPKTAVKLRGMIQSNTTAMQNLISELPTTDALKESWKKIAAEHKKMLDAVGAMSSQGPKSLRTARDLADGSKEILSIVSKIA